MGHKKAGIFGGGIVGGRVRFFVFLKKMGHSRPLFLYFRLFNAQLTVYKCSILKKKYCR